jgi:hypothetical protein
MMIEYLIVSTLLGIEIVITEKTGWGNTGMKDEGVYARVMQNSQHLVGQEK